MKLPRGSTPSRPSPLSRAILLYLAEHPDARDSVDGIHAWWLEGGISRWRRRDVEDAVNALVDAGWIEKTAIGGAGVFGLTPGRRAEVRSRFGDAAGAAPEETPGAEREGSGALGER